MHTITVEMTHFRAELEYAFALYVKDANYLFEIVPPLMKQQYCFFHLLHIPVSVQNDHN